MLLIFIIMEYQVDEYRCSKGKIYTSSDGYKYFSSRAKTNNVYLRCSLFNNGCKGTAKLNYESNLIHSISPHNDSLDDYRSKIYELKTKCKRNAQTDNFRKVFNDVTRVDPSTSLISFKECESAMFRSRRKLQPNIPATALEFSQLLSTTRYAVNVKASVMLNEGIGMIFFSDKLYDFISDMNDIQFESTFQTVPKQFYQLWTILFSVGKHSLPAIHCLMTSKEEALYIAVLREIKKLIPQFQPISTMSDWEQAAKNAFKHVYPDTKLNGC